MDEPMPWPVVVPTFFGGESIEIENFEEDVIWKYVNQPAVISAVRYGKVSNRNV